MTAASALRAIRRDSNRIVSVLASMVQPVRKLRAGQHQPGHPWRVMGKFRSGGVA